MSDGTLVNKHVMESKTQSLFPNTANTYPSVGLKPNKMAFFQG